MRTKARPERALSAERALSPSRTFSPSRSARSAADAPPSPGVRPRRSRSGRLEEALPHSERAMLSSASEVPGNLLRGFKPGGAGALPAELAALQASYAAAAAAADGASPTGSGGSHRLPPLLGADAGSRSGRAAGGASGPGRALSQSALSRMVAAERAEALLAASERRQEDRTIQAAWKRRAGDGGISPYLAAKLR